MTSTIIRASAQLHKAGAGPYALEAVADVKLIDAARNRTIALRVTYPARSGVLPAIVFSHGAWGTNYCYHQLVQHWAGHGYVVIQPDHLDSVAEGVQFGDTVVFEPAFRRARVDDDKHILDNIEDLGVAALRGRIDADRIAIGGHSYGANTSLLLAGMTLYDPDGASHHFGEPRFKASLVLSGQGRRLGMTKNGGGQTEASFATIAMPMIVITGSRDPGRLGETVDWRIEPFNFAPPGDKYLLFIQGADHSFGGLTRENAGFPQIGMRDLPRIPAHVDYVNSATTAFWDAYLLGDAAARAFLATDRMGEITGGDAKVTAK